MTGEPSGRRWRRIGILCGGCALIVVGLAVFSDAAVLSAIRNRLVVLDADFTGGVARRVWTGQRLPRLTTQLRPGAPSSYEWLAGSAFIPIAHGLGPWLEDEPNTMKTFYAGLGRGFRIFEVDLALTRDDSVICYHGAADAQDIDTLTYRGYLTLMARRGSAPCTIRDLVREARNRPQVRFVLDVKNRFERLYSLVRAAIGGPELGRQFIPQVYFFEQLAVVRETPFFGGAIFTSYRSALTTRQIFSYASELGVKAVTITVARFERMRTPIPPGLHVFVHPVDDPFVAMKMRSQGVAGIYTSYVSPMSVPSLFHQPDPRPAGEEKVR